MLAGNKLKICVGAGFEISWTLKAEKTFDDIVNKKMSSPTNEDNEDLEKSDTKSESKLFHSDFGSTWPFKTRRRSSNDSRLMLLGGK